MQINAVISIIEENKHERKFVAIELYYDEYSSLNILHIFAYHACISQFLNFP